MSVSGDKSITARKTKFVFIWSFIIYFYSKLITARSRIVLRAGIGYFWY